MPLRLLSDAGAQTTVSGAITNAQTSITGASTANFPSPQNVGNGVTRLTVLDSGNPGYNAASPLSTPFEYCSYNNNNTGTNVLSGITRGEAGTTAKSFFAGATIAVGFLAEDFIGSVPWKFDDQSPNNVASITIPSSGSIPASYLGITWNVIRIEWLGRSTSGNTGDYLLMQFNGDAAAHYDSNDATASAGVLSSIFSGGAQTSMRAGVLAGGAATAGWFNRGWIEIPFYSQSTSVRHAYTAMDMRQDSLNGIGWNAGQWVPASATTITSITLFSAANNLANGSRFIARLLP